MFDKINFKSLKKIKGFSVVVIPSGTGVETKSNHYSSGKVYAILTIYTLIVMIAGFLIIDVTPARNLFLPSHKTLSPADKVIVDKLNERLIFLTKQLEELKSNNQQLKDAIMLGDSTLIDSLSNKVNKVSEKNNSHFSGNLLAIVNKLFFKKNSKKNKNNSIFFSMPLNGFISRGFNPDNGHMGIDIVASVGSPVYAAASGYVVFSDYTSKDGYMIIIAHSDNYITVYKHCSALLKKTRDVVTEGEMIALSGNSGEITTGPHLHFEIWKNGKPIDPKTVLINY